MSDNQRLEDKIAKLNAAGTGVTASGREIKSPDTDGFLRAILNEIEEIILARELLFENSKGETLGLRIVNRRLMRVSSQSDKTLTRLAAPILEQDFFQESGLLISGLFDFLAEFLKDTSKLIISTKKLEQVPNPADIGCSPEALAQEWSLDLFEDVKNGNEKRVENFVESNAEFILAYIQYDSDGFSKKVGQENNINQLVEFSENGLSRLVGHLESFLHPNSAQYCVILGASQGEGESILYIVVGSKKTLVMVPSNRVSGIYSIWQDQVS